MSSSNAAGPASPLAVLSLLFWPAVAVILVSAVAQYLRFLTHKNEKPAWLGRNLDKLLLAGALFALLSALWSFTHGMYKYVLEQRFWNQEIDGLMIIFRVLGPAVTSLSYALIQFALSRVVHRTLGHASDSTHQSPERPGSIPADTSPQPKPAVPAWLGAYTKATLVLGVTLLCFAVYRISFLSHVPEFGRHTLGYAVVSNWWPAFFAGLRYGLSGLVILASARYLRAFFAPSQSRPRQAFSALPALMVLGAFHSLGQILFSGFLAPWKALESSGRLPQEFHSHLYTATLPQLAGVLCTFALAYALWQLVPQYRKT